MEGWDDLPAASPGADDWPWWRGPTVNNVARSDQNKKPPLEWGADKNILWRVPLAGRGHGTPCIWGDRIFLAAGSKGKRNISVFCLDRETGKEQWRTEVYSGELPRMHKDNSYASGMVACDGERVFFAYQTADAIRMVALGVDGKLVWDEEVAKYSTVQGHSASPAIYKSAVIMTADLKGDARLVALHRKTGKVIWRVRRPGNKESYASPLVARVAGRDQLFIIGPNKTRSYDPGSGELLWLCDGPAEYDAATVGIGADTIYSTGGYPEKALLAIRADGSGNVTGSHLRWKSDRKAGYVPSPLVAGEFVYAVTDKGLMRCYDAVGGKVVWERHLQAPVYSSPVLVGERIYLFDRKGKGYVIQAGETFKILAENTLDDGAFATPVIAGGRIYLRTLGDFYCISASLTNTSKPSPPAKRLSSSSRQGTMKKRHTSVLARLKERHKSKGNSDQ
ncbi:MAG: PQQ-binding-like beta-propeller repeat protein [Phycisphaerae bacterium]|nr:PQQ-binding-like beta-propeller repeat protein [Phycisphaerae bacterium]